MGVLDSIEEKEHGAVAVLPEQRPNKVFLGTVDHFFEKLRVAAIKLEGSLHVGDIIEIGSDEEAIRQRVASMQIDKNEVDSADEGDDVGVKVIHPVQAGSSVYKINQGV